MQHLLIAKNTFYQAFARAASSFIGFLITIILASKFGVLGYGDFTKITSYVTLYYLVIDFGFNAFFLQYKNPKFKDLIFLRILISGGVFILLGFIAFLFPYDRSLNSGFSQGVKIGILIFSFTVFSQAIIISTAAIFQKTLNYFSYAVGIVAGSLINLLIVFIFSIYNFPLIYIIISFALCNFITAFFLLKLSKQTIFPISFDIEFSKDLVLKSLPVGMMLIFNLVYFRADIVILSLLSTTKAVGIYGLSYKFFDFLIALPLFLSNAVYPFLIKSRDNYPEFFSIVKKYFFVFLLFSLILMIPFWFISPLFTLIKSEFNDSILPFRILLLSLPFFFTTSFFQWVLITAREQKYLLYVYLFSTILNVLLNIIFIPKYSYIASAGITVLSEGIVFIFLFTKTITYLQALKKEDK